MSNLISFESRQSPSGQRGPAAGLESLAAQARNAASLGDDLCDFARAALMTAAHNLETAAALAEADLILSEAVDVA